MFLVKPGSVGPLTPLVDILREQHTELLKRVRKDQALRKASGAPLTDDGSPAPVLSDYEAPEHLLGVTVQLVVVSDSERQRLFAGVRSAGGDAQALTAAFAEVVTACVTRIDGEGETHLGPFSPEFIELLAANQLLVPLADAALHFLALPPKKALRCGQPAPLTSQPTSAHGAESHSDVSVGVTAELEPAIFVAPITRATPVHADT